MSFVSKFMPKIKVFQRSWSRQTRHLWI